ncbi:MAG: glycoside hydrolase family 9 protein [Fibrobacter sp.]|nr:glycoside hydrolase family 9 protein [Fibrobacter sp.]
MEFPIRYNHVGYASQAAKIFFVVPEALKELTQEGCHKLRFRIVDSAGCVLHSGSFREGSFEHHGLCDYSGETLWTGDFSVVTKEGLCSIQICECREACEGVVPKVIFETEKFEIGSTWIERQLNANIKSFYFQRSGVELEEKFAGKWARPAAHLDDCIGFHPMMNREGTWNAHGGWYDAGDYGKYLVNGGVSVGTLLLTCELCDGRVKNVNQGGTFELPYSLKDETRFELDFFLRMQDVDGGVFFKVTPEHWDSFVSPADSDKLQKRMILGKSTSSTLNFAGSLAMAAMVYRKDDSAYADLCLEAAKRAYRWALDNPAVDWPHNTEGSGGYGDECVADEFFWTRAALYCNDRDESLRPLLLEDMKVNGPKLGLDWRDTQNFGWILLALQDFDAELQKRAREVLEGTAWEIMRLQKEDAYGLSIRKFIWGSNGEISNHALTLAIVNLWRHEINGESLDFWCREQLNFVYGRNPVSRSFVVGSAWSSPKHPHHRISHGDGIKDPIPGLLVGGINSDRQDTHRAAHYPSDLPGLSYADERCSFASNETAINWNAPLTAVLAMLCR